MLIWTRKMKKILIYRREAEAMTESRSCGVYTLREATIYVQLDEVSWLPEVIW